MGEEVECVRPESVVVGCTTRQQMNNIFFFFPFSSRADYFSTCLSSSLKFVLYHANAKHKNQPITAD